nr:hypothetical protein [uncultured Prevotella sp.]
MKRFLIIGVMAAAFSTHSNACVSEYSDHNYYMFSVFNRDQTSPAYLYDIASYWQKYAGNTSSVNLSFYRWNKEDILKVAKHKKDAGMLSYLGSLNAYLDACEKLNPNAWNYASKQEWLQIQQSLTRLNKASKIYKGTQLKSQYALLRFRTNMMKGFHQQNITYWKAIASRLPKSPWREAMRNIYARALWKTGKHHQALEIYAEQGDMASIRVLARNYRNLAGIQSIYLKNPNSAMLTYLVQDFVNNCQQTIDSRNQNPINKEWIEEIGAKVIYQKEALSFITFANKVIAENKTQNPCLWRSATAMLHYLYGYQQEAWKEISEAVALDGTQRMKDNARAIRLLVSTRNTQVDNDYPQYLVGEFKWLNEMAKGEITRTKGENPKNDDFTNPDIHYVEVKERVAYRALYNRFKTMADKAKKEDRQEAGRNYESMATAMYGMMDAYMRTFYKDQQDEEYISRYLYSSEYAFRLDSLSAQQLADYYRFITSSHQDAFEQYVCQSLYRNADFFKDMIGTKYLAEGNFGEAACWQKDVSLKFINNQTISFYAEKRSYSVPYWFNHQKVNDSDMWSIQGSYAHLKENPKWKFCQEMNQLIGQYNVTREGESREKLAYELATRYYQASCYGDCWYLTHYGKSVADSARTGEADFAAIAQDYLKISKQSSNLTLRYHSLYALSSIGIDPWFKITYDANWKEQKLLQPQSAQYQAMMEWSKFCHQHPEIVDQYTTRCDVLKQFEKNL